MGTEVRVFKYDDMTRAETGEMVEADHTGVPLTFGKTAVTLDLSKINYDKIARWLGPYLKAGTPVGSVNSRSTPGAKRGRKPREYYVALEEFIQQRTGRPVPRGADKKMKYDEALRREFDEGLRAKEGAGAADSVG